VALQPRLDLRVFVRGVVVEDAQGWRIHI
jgi:hypothetical protein